MLKTPGRSWSGGGCVPRTLLVPSGATHCRTGARIGEREMERELDIARRDLNALQSIRGLVATLLRPGHSRVIARRHRKCETPVGVRGREVSIGQDQDDRRHPVMDVAPDLHDPRLVEQYRWRVLALVERQFKNLGARKRIDVMT